MNSVRILRCFKNKFLSHSTIGTLAQPEFNKIWSDIIKSIMQIDMEIEDSKKFNDNLLTMEKKTLDETLCQQYYTHCIDIFDSLGEIQKNQIQTIKKIDKLEHIMTDVVQEEGTYNNNGWTTLYRGRSERHANLHFEQEIDISTKFRLEKNIISDGLLRDDGLIVLASFKTNAIITFYMDRPRIDLIRVEFSPWDITTIDSTAVAITFPEAKCIEIYDITSRTEKIRRLNLSYRCFKITSIQNKLIVACIKDVLLFMDWIRGVCVHISTPVSPDDSLRSAGDRIYHSHYVRNTLTCYHDDGIRLYRVDLGGKPQGMTSILHNNLLVLMKDGELRLMSSDGYSYEYLEYEDHKLKDPRILSYSHKLHKIIVADRHGLFNLYSVQDIL